MKPEGLRDDIIPDSIEDGADLRVHTNLLKATILEELLSARHPLTVPVKTRS
jgi:hypothetical protein